MIIFVQTIPFMILKNVSFDCVIFGFKNNKLNVLLWQAETELLKKFYTTKGEQDQIDELFRKNHSFFSDDFWGLIGTHLPVDENLDIYAKKMLQMTTGINNIYLKQYYTFGRTERVPYNRVLTVAYYALINPDHYNLKQSPFVKSVKWFEIDRLPKVIFDEKEIILMALKELRQEVKYHPIGFHLLPEKFTLKELQTLYESILDKKLDTRNFRKKILNMKLLTDTKEKQLNVAHRAAKLYTFDVEIYNQLKEEGLTFRI